MTIITITIETDNAAFDDDFEGEVTRLLESIGERISNKPGLVLNLHDVNGNHCGTCRVEADGAGPRYDGEPLYEQGQLYPGVY